MSTLDWIAAALRPVFGPIAKLHNRLVDTFKRAAYGVRDGYNARAWRRP